MALSDNSARVYELGNVNEFPMLASVTIYEGSAVTVTSAGYAHALVKTDPRFVGFAESKVVNSVATNGAANVRVIPAGLVQLDVTGVTVADNVGTAVYASDDNTFTTTSTSNLKIGVVHRVVSAGVAIVRFYSNVI